ncbi:MAG: glycosyltransferase [Actinomyces sp.]|nr:MAG: glycosyltransferase [Actinomyces sp.]
MTVVIVHRDRPDVLPATVAAFAATDRDGPAVRVMVVDNASGPSSAPVLDALAGAGVEVVTSPTNLGFGPGANVGLRRWLRRGGGTWVAVAPHDARPRRDTLARLVEAGRADERLGLISADVGDGATPLVDPFLGAIGGPQTITEGFEPGDYPHGTLLMARRACLEQVGVFDERYFAYCEEADLGLRARAAGWEVGVVRGARVDNPGMSTAVERVAYLQLRNTLLLLREHYGRRQSLFRAVFALGRLPVGVVHPPARGLHWSPVGRLRGIADHYRGRYGPPPVWSGPRWGGGSPLRIRRRRGRRSRSPSAGVGYG